MTTMEQSSASQASTVAGGLPAEPSVGCVGRTSELAALTEALTAQEPRGPVLVWGYEGLGKTTLVSAAARALVQRGRYARAVHTRFSGGGYPELALYDLGRALLGNSWAPAEKDAEQRVLKALRDTSVLLVWDQVEALMPRAPGVTSGERLTQLLELGARLTAEGSSRICLIADSPSAPQAVWGNGPQGAGLAVEGLSQADGQSLLQALLAANGMEPAEDAACEALVRGLGGQPMALCLTAAAAERRPVAALLTELENILPGFGAGEARLRNQSLDVAVELWLRCLGERERLQVLALAPFVDGLMLPLGGSLHLEETSDWKQLMPRLKREQLLWPVSIPGLSVEYAYLGPGLARRLDQRLTEPQRAVLSMQYGGAYIGLLTWMMGQDSRAARTMQGLFRCELPNLRHVAEMLLGTEQLNDALQFARQVSSWMARLGLHAEAAHLAEVAKAATNAALPKEGPLARAGVHLLLAQAEQSINAGQMPAAVTMLSALEQRSADEKGLTYTGEEALIDRGATLHMLGRALLAVGQTGEAVKRLTAAVELFAQAQPSERVQRDLTNAYGHLGEAYLASQQTEGAENAFRKGLELARLLQDGRLSGLMQIGQASVAAARGDDAGASELLHAALATLEAAGESEAMVEAWQQLAVLGLRKGDLAESEQALLQALTCAEKAANGALQTQISLQLGQVLEATDRLDEARARYERAGQLGREHRLMAQVIAAEKALAGLLLKSGDLQNAKEHAMEARAYADAVGAQASPWLIYELLGRIAEAEGNAEREAHWRLSARESYAGSPEAKALVAQWTKLSSAVLEACRGASLEAEAVEALERLEAAPDWGSLAGAIWRILSGERGPEVYADLGLPQAAVARHIVAELQKA